MSFDPNDIPFDDGFDIGEFTSKVDFDGTGDTGEAAFAGQTTGEYKPVGSEEPVPAHKRRKHKKKKLPLGLRILRGLLIFLVYLLVLVVAGYFLADAGWKWGNDLLALDKPDAPYSITLEEEWFTQQETTDEDGEVSTYYVADMDAVAQELQENGLINYPWLFKLFAVFTGKDDAMAPGTYEVNSNMDYSALLRNLRPRTGALTTVKVMIPEGYTLEEIYALLEEQGVCSAEELRECAANYDFDYDFLDDSTLGQDKRLEGYLYPDTYEFYENSKPETALNKLLSNFKLKLTDQMQDRLKELGYSLEEIIIIASIIEKETDGQDQTGIASVIYNRLENTSAGTQGYLQMDSCIQYILPERKDKLTSEDIAIESPYNTYLYKGLPAGPICNPGYFAIHAALYPEESDWYYFIAGTDGETHFFSRYNDFLNYKNSLGD